MKNNRHYKRYAVKCSGWIIDKSSQKYRFHVNDISASGMNIATDKELDDAQMLSIKFDISGTLLPHAKRLEGEIVRKNRTNTGYNYSIRFLGLTHNEIVEMDEYLRYVQRNCVVVHL
jgi:c-di-GMP-binding flagellar brake protein YcgR